MLRAKNDDPQRQMLALLTEVLAIAKGLAQTQTMQGQRRKAAPGHNVKSDHPGIYPAKSKYNDWRAYVWDTAVNRSVYIGMFPSISKAKAAQRAYLAGKPMPSGTKASKVVTLRAVA